MSLVLFGGIIALIVIMVGALADNYDNTDVVSEEFADSFDNYEETTQYAGDMFDSASGEGGISTVGTFDILFKSTFAVISLVFTSVENFGGQMLSFVGFFDIPTEVGFVFFGILGALITVMIVFIIISSVSRRDI